MELKEHKVAAGATYEPIATTTLGSAASSITFSSIPNTYTDLRLVLTGYNASTGNAWMMQYNSDTATNYSFTRLGGTGSAADSGRTTSTARIYIGDIYNNNSNTIPALATIDIFSYAGSTYKTALSNFSGDQNGSGSTISFVSLWRSTSAINTVVLKNDAGANFSAGTTATLYGIKAA